MLITDACAFVITCLSHFKRCFYKPKPQPSLTSCKQAVNRLQTGRKQARQSTQIKPAHLEGHRGRESNCRSLAETALGPIRRRRRCTADLVWGSLQETGRHGKCGQRGLQPGSNLHGSMLSLV